MHYGRRVSAWFRPVPTRHDASPRAAREAPHLPDPFPTVPCTDVRTGCADDEKQLRARRPPCRGCRPCRRRARAGRSGQPGRPAAQARDHPARRSASTMTPTSTPTAWTRGTRAASMSAFLSFRCSTASSCRRSCLIERVFPAARRRRRHDRGTARWHGPGPHGGPTPSQLPLGTRRSPQSCSEPGSREHPADDMQRPEEQPEAAEHREQTEGRPADRLQVGEVSRRCRRARGSR